MFRWDSEVVDAVGEIVALIVGHLPIRYINRDCRWELYSILHTNSQYTGDYTFPEIDPVFPLDTTTNPTAFPLQPNYQPQHALPPNGLPNPYTITSPPFNAVTYTGTKHQSSSPAASVHTNIEDVSKNAIDEDKRRRNTAASARFRVKKKQREQALERTTKDLTDKANALQSKLVQLQTENEWLRKLVIEKNGEESFEEQYGRFTKEAERIVDKSKHGVGTEGKL